MERRSRRLLRASRGRRGVTRSVPARDVAALLQRTSWTLTVGGNDERADLWEHLDSGASLYLPHRLNLGSFVWSDVLERIGAVLRKPASEVLRDIELGWYDVTRFRVDSDGLGTQTVPLDAAATVVNSAFGMLRAAATTARQPRQAIGQNYSKIGDELARQARLAHTEPGSFVFPVLMRVGEPSTEDHPSLEGLDEVTPESSERRIVRTLAQALQAFDRHVVQPATDPSMESLLPVIYAGGAKEIFSQLLNAMKQPAVDWVETSFAWAAEERAPTDLPEKLTFPIESQELVERAVKVLAEPSAEPIRVITGPIVQIRHLPGEPFGEIAVQSPNPRNFKVGRIEMRVRADQLGEIHLWMDSGTTVVVEGIVEKRPNRAARLRDLAVPRDLGGLIEG